jgi:hypothetical protein
MPTDLARAIVAFINLVREAETRQQDRARLRAAAEEVALILLQQLRVGDSATVGSVVYEAEQIIWSEPVNNASGSGGGSNRHGARALLRDNRVLVVAERAERGRGPSRARTRLVGTQFARREPAQASDHPSFDLHMATDQDRVAFAQELGAVVEGFALTAAADAGQLRSATTELLALLTS